MYRASHVVEDLGWVDYDLSVPPSCQPAQPLLPNSHQPVQNWAERGTLKLQFNTTRFYDHMERPVHDTYPLPFIQECLVMSPSLRSSLQDQNIVLCTYSVYLTVDLAGISLILHNLNK